MSPASVQLTFDETVSISAGAVSLHLSGGGPIWVGHATLGGAGRRVSAAVLAPPAAARYTVGWQVTADDGDVVAGSFDFAVVAPGRPNTVLVGAGASRPNTQGLVLLVGLRWLLFAGLALGLGGVCAEVLLARRARRSTPGPGQTPELAPAGSSTPAVTSAWAQVLLGALVGLAGAAGLSVLLAGGGSVLHGLGSLGRLPGEHAGRIVLVEVIGFAGAAAAARWTDGWSGTGVGLAVVVAAEAVRNHVGSYAGAPGVLLVGIHLAAAAVWAGALAHVIRVAVRQRADRALARGIFGAYARLVVALYVVVVATGTISAVFVVGSRSALMHTRYGHILLVKLALVAVASGLALAGRLRLRRPGRGPGWLVKAERAALFAVLAGSAVLVSVAPPRPVNPASSLPRPPVTGPALRLGSLLGQVSTQVVASSGRVDVRFTTPDAGTGDPAYGVEATLNAGGSRSRRVRLVGCGAGCFTGKVNWPGATSLSVSVSASGWHGGRHAFDVSWPPHVDSSILPRVARGGHAAGRR